MDLLFYLPIKVELLFLQILLSEFRILYFSKMVFIIPMTIIFPKFKQNHLYNLISDNKFLYIFISIHKFRLNFRKLIFGI